MFYQPTTIKFKEFTSFIVHGHQREYSEGQEIHVPLKAEYADGELTPYHAALLVQMKKAQVV